MDRVTINIETQGGLRASEIIADLRAAAETLYYPMTLVGFWDYRAGHAPLCPQEERRESCPHELPDDDPDRVDYRMTMQRERQGNLEVFFPHAGIRGVSFVIGTRIAMRRGRFANRPYTADKHGHSTLCTPHGCINDSE